MEDRKTLAAIFMDTHHLLHRYNIMWYGKNFGGLEPQQGQGRILMALQRMTNVSQRELGYILGIRPQSLGELLQKLESNGYITRQRSTTDKRTFTVELTEKGKNFRLLKPDYDELFAELDWKEQLDLRKSLEKISSQLEEMISREQKNYSYEFY